MKKEKKRNQKQYRLYKIYIIIIIIISGWKMCPCQLLNSWNNFGFLTVFPIILVLVPIPWILFPNT